MFNGLAGDAYLATLVLRPVQSILTDLEILSGLFGSGERRLASVPGFFRRRPGRQMTSF
jgi:hypothetical protein